MLLTTRGNIGKSGVPRTFDGKQQSLTTLILARGLVGCLLTEYSLYSIAYLFIKLENQA